MARSQTNKKSLSNLVLWRPGQSGNPKGPGKRLPEELYNIKKFTKEQLEHICSALLYATEDELSAIGDDVEAPYIWRIMTKILKKSHDTGSMMQLDMVLNRLIGKVKERLEVDDLRPSVLVRRDGTEVIFTKQRVVKSGAEDDE